MRDYKEEYRTFHGTPIEKKKRAKRNTVRRRLARKGLVRKGDGRDVHHKNGDPFDDSPSNLTVISASKNRSIK